MALEVSEPNVVAAVTEDLPGKTDEAEEAGADAIEVRIDMYDGGTEKAVSDIGDHDDHGLPVIATNRRTDGQTEGKRLDSLVMATEYAEAVDIDITSPERTIETVVEAARNNDTTVIASYHDFEGTPPVDGMMETLGRSWELGDIAKLAVTPEDEGDVLDLLRVTLEARDRDGPFCAISMGALGSYTRFLAPLYGSCLTYASYGNGTAPGQLSVKEINEQMDRFEA